MPIPVRCEVDFLEGLEQIVRDELDEQFGADITLRGTTRPDALSFDYRGAIAALLALRSVVAVSLVRSFPVPRPKALLGHQHFTTLVDMIDTARELWPSGRFETLKLSAAGEDSSVMNRLKLELEQRTGLRPDPEEGDLLLRLRPAANGWEALVRLSPRPLATRPWRVCNLPGALNATVAHAMMRLTQPRPDDVVLNLACGSGTLMIERLALAPVSEVIGCDTDQAALACAHDNLEAATGHEVQPGDRVRLEPWDATHVPLPDTSVDAICADLPFGQLVGSHRENEALYPRIVAEAARLARHGAVMVLITHEVRLLERVIGEYAHAWRVNTVLRVRSGGMTPRIYLLERV